MHFAQPVHLSGFRTAFPSWISSAWKVQAATQSESLQSQSDIFQTSGCSSGCSRQSSWCCSLSVRFSGSGVPSFFAFKTLRCSSLKVMAPNSSQSIRYLVYGIRVCADRQEFMHAKRPGYLETAVFRFLHGHLRHGVQPHWKIVMSSPRPLFSFISCFRRWRIFF